MGGIIPHSVKLQVLEGWISGISRDDVALNNGISCGTVSNIIKELRKKEVVDIDLLRIIAVKMKKEGLELYDLSSSIRLWGMLDYLELPEERVEKLLQALSIYNYKNDIEEPEKFIHAIEKISDYIVRLNVSVFDIIDYVEKKKTELKKLKLDILIASMDLGELEYKKSQVMMDVTKSEAAGTCRNDSDDQ